MKRLYKNKIIEELIEDLNDVSKSRLLIKKYMDINLIKILKRRCNELEAASDFEFIVRIHFGGCESLKGNFAGFYSLTLSGNIRLIIRPNAINLEPETLRLCKEYYFEGVVDYHDKKKKTNWIIP